MAKVSILDWNVWMDENPHNITIFLKQQDADIICCQELFKTTRYNSPEIIGRGLGYEFHVSLNQEFERDSEPALVGCGIFSHFPITAQRTMALDVTDEENPRNYVEVDVRINKMSLTVGTAHLYFSPGFAATERKIEQARALLSVVKPDEEKFILAGDLNSTPDSKVINMISANLVNIGPDLREPTWTTKPFSYAGFTENKLRWRIDYIFGTKDITKLSSKVVKTNLSDHLPILTEIEI